MTTSGVRVARESIDDWPKLKAMGLSAPFAVLTIEARGYDHRSGIELAARAFADALARTMPVGDSLAVLVRLGLIDLNSRLAQHRFAKNGPWQLLASEDLLGLSGSPRVWASEGREVPTEYFGEIAISTAEICPALSATWQLDSAIVCGNSAAWGAGAFPESQPITKGIFESSASMLVDRFSIVARGFGGFGDPVCGVDVVADESVLDGLEYALRK